jgi:polyketide synthase PksN
MLVRAINETLAIEVEPSTLLEHSTVDELTDYILSRWKDEIAPQLGMTRAASTRSIGTDVSEAAQGRDSRRADAEPIAVIGMSGRFAESESLDAFWNNLKLGRDLVKQVSRWSTADCFPAGNGSQVYCTEGSFVDSISRFDAAFFGISAEEATGMDPQQRLLLEEAWRALEDAGYAGASVEKKQCGIYVGCGDSCYDSLTGTDSPSHAVWGNADPSMPARIAQNLGLRGPALAVDTASSSSLVAVHLACQSLWSQETEMALAGGVFLQATPAFFKSANRAGLLSPYGRCHAFDANADGFVPGEGVGVLVLKRLRDALRDGDHIHGVIAGAGVDQGDTDGSDANGQAQERLARSVYDRFRIDPAAIQVLEADGTGIASADSIEYSAISRAIRGYTDKRQYCAIGTVKSNIGHAGAAAGMAGLLKLLLSLKHRQIPATLHFTKGNPAIDFQSSPFYVNTELKEWRLNGDQKRRAAVSSLGLAGGANAHVVLEEAPEAARAAIEAPAYLVALSARSGEQLTQQARNLLALLKGTPALPLNDLSFTLLTGRRHLGHRLVCVARHQAELIRLLEQWTSGVRTDQVYSSEVRELPESAMAQKAGSDCIDACGNTKNADEYLKHLSTIAGLHAQGHSLEFHRLFAPASRRMPLPTYPFADESYWIDAAAARLRPTAADPQQSDQAAAGGARIEISNATLLENILWQETSLLEDGYEKVTF